VTPRFGEVWTIGQGGDDDILPPVPHLVVSGDLYNESGLGMILCEVNRHQLTDPEISEPVAGLGIALLDRVVWFPQSWLREHVGDLSPDRFDHVKRVVRNLIGND
jgi:mRNA-degrading endonuclease toxin of MazEF toxin-antitoxin module